MTPDFPQWLQDRPLARSVLLDLPPPSLKDNTGDLEGSPPRWPGGLRPVRFRHRDGGLWRRGARTLVGARVVPVLPVVSGVVLDAFSGLDRPSRARFAVDLGPRWASLGRLIDMPAGRSRGKSTRNPQSAFGESSSAGFFSARNEGGWRP